MANNGWSNQTTTLLIIVEPTGGGQTGLFFYSPTIGAGNLVGSWTTVAGTDSYGNFYPAGLAVFDTSNGHYANLVDAGLAFSIGHSFDPLGRGIVVNGTVGSGTSLQSVLTITGANTGGGGSELNLYSTSADGTSVASHVNVIQDLAAGTSISGNAVQTDGVAASKFVHMQEYNLTFVAGTATLTHGCPFTPVAAVLTSCGPMTPLMTQVTYTTPIGASSVTVQGYTDNGTPWVGAAHVAGIFFA